MSFIVLDRFWGAGHWHCNARAEKQSGGQLNFLLIHRRFIHFVNIYPFAPSTS